MRQGSERGNHAATWARIAINTHCKLDTSLIRTRFCNFRQRAQIEGLQILQTAQTANASIRNFRTIAEVQKYQPSEGSHSQ